MQLKHTPGPWKVDQNYISTGFFIHTELKHRELASVNERIAGIDKTEAKANALLIAAAPDLYAACMEAAETLKSMQHENTFDDYDRNVLDKCLEAIAKATGADQCN